MADRPRPGFTLVELLVVVVIITMLIGLLLPAVIAARAKARQTQCSNNQHELALAIQQFEVAKDHLPGYINNFGSASKLSWVVVIFPHLGREDLWTEWREPTWLGPAPPPICTYETKRANHMIDMPQLKCPSDTPPENTGALSYVANCGIEARTQTAVPPGSGNMKYEGPAHGLFHDRTVASPITMQSERIPDGASNTLLLSENIQATQWAPPQIDLLETDPAQLGYYWTGLEDLATGRDWREAHVGMVWTQSPVKCNWVNKCSEVEIDAANPDIRYARPSSLHTDGVVVTYADGHQDYFFEDERDERGNLDTYQVYQRLMAPDDDRAGL